MGSMVYDVVNGAYQFHRRGLFLLFEQLLDTNELLLVVELYAVQIRNYCDFGLTTGIRYRPIIKIPTAMQSLMCCVFSIHIDDETREK